MDAKEIKTALKEAREKIKNKDFKSALKICKNVLKADRNNYIGLVLFGVALQETGQREQAPNAFKKAIDVSPNQMLAWQGLASFYESENCATNKNELLEVYAQLLMLESDLNKFTEICAKLVAVGEELNENEKCIHILEKQELSSNYEEKKVIWKTVVSVLGQIKDLTQKLSESLESVLEKILEDGSFEGTEDYFKKYLKLLYRHRKWDTLIKKAQDMHILYPNLEYPLEWICRAYSERLTVSSTVDTDNIVDIDTYCDKLTTLNQNSSMVLLAKGAKLYQEASYAEASEILKEVLSVMPNSCYVWALLCQCYSNIHRHTDCAQCATEALKHTGKNFRDEPLQGILNILLVRALSYQTSAEKATLAIEKCKELLLTDHGNPDVISCLARAYITVNNLDAVQKCIEVLESQESYKTIALLLRALKFKKETMPFRAIDVLNEGVTHFPHMPELWLELGKLQLEIGQQHTSFSSFLKAAKLDPNCYMCFVYLGRHYSLNDADLDKARRCFEKAFQLNPYSEEAGSGLSDVLRLQKSTELNEQLLTYVTEEAGPGGAKWAWLRLGLHYQDLGKHQAAVNSLRAALKSDPMDSHSWESLADAYLASGAYTSALKSYQRVVELSPEALYPAYQVAAVKQLIGLYEEALPEYKMVLAINPKYVPALKGLGETCLSLAKSYLERQLFGCCRDLCQEAVDTLTKAAEEHQNLSSLWKLIGDVCSLMAKLPENRAQLYVEHWLVRSTPSSGGGGDNTVRELLAKDKILQLGARCYCRSLSISPTSLTWHDLAANYHYQANNATSQHTKKQLQEWALTAAKRSVSLSPKNGEHWNILGVIASSNEIGNFKLGQHAFIKSIQLDSNNFVAWTNLGTLYLTLGDIKLANEAFGAAQSTEPTYMQCWIGQALIAESVNHEATMGLFRHATELGVHPESCLGYTQWVCTTLLNCKDASDPNYVSSIKRMHAVPRAGDCMTWYTASYFNNACAFNMLGLIMERQKLYHTAAKAFAKALKVLENDKDPKVSELQDKVRCNYARVLVQLQQYEEAIQIYREIKEATFVSQCGLAVAYFKAEKYQDSYSAYETILHWLAPDDGLKSHILVAMAAMAYTFKGVEDSKTLLFQSVRLKPPSVQGLFASCSLGIIHGDLTLSEMVLKELAAHQHNPEYVTHIAVFKAYTHYLQNRRKEAVRSLSSTMHVHPEQASLWLSLALLLFYSYPDCDSSAAARCAMIALHLGQSTTDVSKVMSLVSLGHLFSGKALPSLRSSQKAVHMFPDIPENWVVLVASFLPRCMTHKSLPEAVWLKHLIGHIRRKMDATRKMGKWLSRHENKVTLLMEEYSQKS